MIRSNNDQMDNVSLKLKMTLKDTSESNGFKWEPPLSPIEPKIKSKGVNYFEIASQILDFATKYSVQNTKEIYYSFMAIWALIQEHSNMHFDNSYSDNDLIDKKQDIYKKLIALILELEQQFNKLPDSETKQHIDSLKLLSSLFC